MENCQEEQGANSWLPGFLRRSKSPKPNIEEESPDETTALLPKSDDEETGSVYDLEDGDRSKSQLIFHEFWVLFKGSLPVILAYTLQMSLQTASVLIVGRLSPEALATAAFAYMFAMSTGWLIALGGTTAIDTLASATFTGSKNPQDLGVILQRSFIVLLLFYIPVVILWICAEPVFLTLGQEPYIARDSARFLTVLAPGGVGYIYFECMKKYLQAQGKALSISVADCSLLNGWQSSCVPELMSCS
jgi:multidrug resistance protein, MATE family